jgi:hypothetical protein
LAKSLAPSSSSLALRVLVRLNHESVQVPRRPSKQRAQRRVYILRYAWMTWRESWLRTWV